MSLSIKRATEIAELCASDWLKGLPSERQVRVEEHSRPRVVCPAVHIVLELDELINAVYPHFISNNDVCDEGNKKRNKKKETHTKEK